MKFVFVKIWPLILLVFLAWPMNLSAREQITDWYIKDFRSEIVLNQDSSLDIIEKITADCGDLPDKHGIFRILPTETKKTDQIVIKNPIKLISITDFNDGPIKYTETKSYADGTITWKIGDPEKTVVGINYYKIHYQVRNAVRSGANYDELYWNLNGNFWDIETDNFSAKISFPTGISTKNSTVDYYVGSFGQTTKDSASFSWVDDQTLEFRSSQTLATGEGITTSIAFPKGIVSPYTPGFWEKYGRYFSFLIPLLTLFICLWLWAKYGRDPKIGGPVVPEFEAPEGLTPMEVGEVMTNGNLSSKYISAGIVGLAVNGHLKINKLKGNDYELERLEKSKEKLTSGEKVLLEKLFKNDKKIELSELKNEFYKEVDQIEGEVKVNLRKTNYVRDSGVCSQVVFIVISVMFGFGAVAAFEFEKLLTLSFLLASGILILFVFLIPKRTVENARIMKKIEGFRLYMKTAEKYRQKFNEKENIFETFLPYAMVFGIVGLWVEKMKVIYGEEYFSTYHPVWFYGASVASFNAGSFSSSMESLSSSMSSTIASSPSSSGAGGGGFSGGGGGGGGGGGW